MLFKILLLLNINHHQRLTVKMRFFKVISPNSVSQLHDKYILEHRFSFLMLSCEHCIFILVSLFVWHTYGVCFSSNSFILPFDAMFSCYSCHRIFRPFFQT